MKPTIWIGILLLIVGSSIWLYSNWEIMVNEKILASSSLTIQEVWRYEGALQYWKTAYSIIITPTTVIFVTTGLITMISPKLARSLNKRSVISEFEKNLQQNIE